MAHTPTFSDNKEFDALMDLGFKMEVPEGDSANQADSTSKDSLENSDEELVEAPLDESDAQPSSSPLLNDPTESIPGESEWSQRNRLPIEEQEDLPKDDLFALLQDRLLYHPLANQIKLDRYVRRLRLISL